LACIPLIGLAQETESNKENCDYDCCRPDGHAPIGIMTDHVHPKGEWGFSYSWMNMNMQGSQSGTQMLSKQQVLTNYMMAPDKMSMQMHMGMLMYGISDRLSAMLMFSYTHSDMNMVALPAAMNMPGMSSGSNAPMTNSTSGLSDTRLYGLYKLYQQERQRIVVALGVSLPSGSITVNGPTLLGEDQRLSYPMQRGSGTCDLLPGITYTGQRDDFSWGLETDADIRPAYNTQGYNLGNMYAGNAWFSWRCCKWISSSLRLEETVTDKISGYSNAIYTLSNNDPTANTLNSGGQRTSIFLGINLYKFQQPLKGNRLLVEYGIPVYQNLNGIQMPVQNTVLAGWQYNF
ncbi:MAG TPA: hypothetical protein VNZ86_11750, partial [Bacteroidia bacterium]|nr:hypothetical protein [Bacteroidia bacterium]